MSVETKHAGRKRRKTVMWLSIGGGLLLLAFANGHFLYMAATSETKCIDHVRLGDGSAERGQFSAAESACTPD
jgi:hypothetical protein